MTISIGRRIARTVSLVATPERADAPGLDAAVGASDAELARLARRGAVDPVQERWDALSRLQRLHS